MSNIQRHNTVVRENKETSQTKTPAETGRRYIETTIKTRAYKQALSLRLFQWCNRKRNQFSTIA